MNRRDFITKLLAGFSALSVYRSMKSEQEFTTVEGSWLPVEPGMLPSQAGQLMIQLQKDGAQSISIVSKDKNGVYSLKEWSKRPRISNKPLKWWRKFVERYGDSP